MKSLLFTFLLLASLLGNFLLIRHYVAAPTEASACERSIAAEKHGSAEAEAWAKLDDRDIEVFARKLAETGMPESLRKCLLRARIKEMYPEPDTDTEPGRKRNYWELQTPYTSPPSFAKTLAKRRAQAMRELTTAKVLGFDDESLGNLSQKLGYAPREKWLDILTLMAGKGVEAEALASSIVFLGTESERNRSRLLNDELDTGLKQILTPSEFAEFKFRSSQNITNLRHALAMFDCSETEFRSIWAAREKMMEVERTPGVDPGGMPDFSRIRVEKERIQEGLKASLGESRFAEYQKATDSDYTLLKAMCVRLDIPETASDSAYDCKKKIQAESLRIFEDKTMRYQEKLAALKQLAVETRARLISVLGAEAGKAYIEQCANSWIDPVEKGGAIQTVPTGTSTRMLMPDGGG